MIVRFKKTDPEGVNTQYDDEYKVFGIVFNKNIANEKDNVQYLINWGGTMAVMRIDELDILDGTIPTNWKIGFSKPALQHPKYPYLTSDSLYIGYKELVDNPFHFIDLFEHEPDALKTMNENTL